jgi:hypothetical protein
LKLGYLVNFIDFLPQSFQASSLNFAAARLKKIHMIGHFSALTRSNLSERDPEQRSH